MDQARARRELSAAEGDNAVPISRLRGELAGLLTVTYPKSRLGDMVLDDELASQL